MAGLVSSGTGSGGAPDVGGVGGVEDRGAAGDIPLMMEMQAASGAARPVRTSCHTRSDAPLLEPSPRAPSPR